MRHFFRFLGRFLRIQWKMILSYMLMNVVTLIIFEVSGLLLVAQSIINEYPKLALESLKTAAEDSADYFASQRLEQKGLTDYLQNIDGNLSSVYLDQGSGVSVDLDVVQGFTVAVNKQGRVLAAADPDTTPVGSDIHKKLSPNGEKVLLAVWAGRTDASLITSGEQGRTVIITAPVMHTDGRVVAVLISKQTIPDLGTVLNAIFPLLLPSLALITALGALMGSIFGFFMSRRLVRRFRKVEMAADSWSKGKFVSFVKDTSADELGCMARQLNSMATQLELLLQTRQRLATMEERNRLARDLHDTVKQQIFAIAMQVGSAQSFIEYNVEEAKSRLVTIEHLVYQAQEELSSLIHQLRPVALTHGRLAKALSEYCENWSRQHEVSLDMEIDAEDLLSLDVEEALFRVAQEALSNVARHSKATSVDLRLKDRGDAVDLLIADNGRGFEEQAADRYNFGLRSMQERMEAVGGSLQVESSPSRGTRLMACCKKVGITTLL